MIVPITGRQLTLPEGPIFNLQRADQSDHTIGKFRSWAGYKNFGADSATNGLVLFQHVLSFSGSETTGRTGIHGHFAHAHIVIPTSGRAMFSYDGVITTVEPGAVIVQHGGTIHDQFEYTYAAASDTDNRKTSLTIEPVPIGAQNRSFGFLEFFVPLSFANVEIIPPKNVCEVDQRTAWDHPYHAEGANFSIRHANSPDAAYRPSWDETILKLATPKLGCLLEDWWQLGLFVQPPRPVQKAPLSALVSAERRAGLMYFTW